MPVFFSEAVELQAEDSATRRKANWHPFGDSLRLLLFDHHYRYRLRSPITGRLSLSSLSGNLELVNLFTNAMHKLRIYIIGTSVQLLHDEKKRKRHR
jgi:hypothetical protein